jgi:hypothetical protein
MGENLCWNFFPPLRSRVSFSKNKTFTLNHMKILGENAPYSLERNWKVQIF